VGPETKIIAVVKANAYGHGAVSVARLFVEQKMDMLAVGDSTEAMELRDAGIAVPILILGAIVDREVSDVVRHNITVAIHSRQRIASLEAECLKQDRRLPVHLKVDTGMGRLGVMPQVTVELAQAILDAPHLDLQGIYSHFAAATVEDPSPTEKQIHRFEEVRKSLKEKKIHPALYHLANSAGAVRFPQSHLNAVRAGAFLYGMDPGLIRASSAKLHPALTLKSQVIYLKDIPQGETVGYGVSFLATRDSRYATLPIGYDDGYSSLYVQKGCVLIHAKKAPVVAVTMDYAIVDVGHIPDVEVGDEVVLLGAQGDMMINVEEIAAWRGTSPYEVTCALGRRVCRINVEA